MLRSFSRLVAQQELNIWRCTISICLYWDVPDSDPVWLPFLSEWPVIRLEVVQLACRSPIVFSFTNCAALRQWNCFLSHRVGWDHILPRHHTVQVRAWNRIKISILYVVMRTARSVLLCFVLDINLFWTLQTWRTQLQPVIVVASVEDSGTEAGKWNLNLQFQNNISIA